MSRGPVAGLSTKTNFLLKARTAWGAGLPDWVEELAKYATQKSSVLAAQKIGYSPAVLSHVFANSYRGDMGRVEAKVRGALMHECVECPILGEIGRHRCLDEQKTPFAATSSIRAKLYRACRAGCPHSRINPE